MPLPVDVLIVEDDDDIRIPMAELLQHDGLQVEQARNGVEGIERMMRNRPRVVVIDMTMRPMNGAQVVAYMQTIPSLATVPVVRIGAGIEDVELRKPFGIEALRALLEPLLGPRP